MSSLAGTPTVNRCVESCTPSSVSRVNTDGDVRPWTDRASLSASLRYNAVRSTVDVDQRLSICTFAIYVYVHVCFSSFNFKCRRMMTSSFLSFVFVCVCAVVRGLSAISCIRGLWRHHLCVCCSSRVVSRLAYPLPTCSWATPATVESTTRIWKWRPASKKLLQVRIILWMCQFWATL